MATAGTCSRLSDTAGRDSPLEQEQEPKPNRTLQTPNLHFNEHQNHTDQTKASSLNENKNKLYSLFRGSSWVLPKDSRKKQCDRKETSNGFVTVSHPTRVMPGWESFPQTPKPLVSPYLALGGMAVFQHVMPVPKQNPLE